MILVKDLTLQIHAQFELKTYIVVGTYTSLLLFSSMVWFVLAIDNEAPRCIDAQLLIYSNYEDLLDSETFASDLYWFSKYTYLGFPYKIKLPCAQGFHGLSLHQGPIFHLCWADLKRGYSRVYAQLTAPYMVRVSVVLIFFHIAITFGVRWVPCICKWSPKPPQYLGKLFHFCKCCPTQCHCVYHMLGTLRAPDQGCQAMGLTFKADVN